MYKETGKEKIIRFSIIAAIATVTLYLFVNQYAPQEESTTTSIQHEKVQQMAIVLQERTQIEGAPILAMVKEHEGEPYLVTYQVDAANNYRFETIDAVNLENSPTEIQLDKVTDGIWLKEASGWIYYNRQLQTEKRQEKYKMESEDGFFFDTEVKEDGKFLLKVMDEQGPILEKTLEEKPVSIVRLSEENDLWFVLFEKDTILLVP